MQLNYMKCMKILNQTKRLQLIVSAYSIESDTNFQFYLLYRRDFETPIEFASTGQLRPLSAPALLRGPLRPCHRLYRPSGRRLCLPGRASAAL
jgi:hypothetical protein